MQSKLTKNLLLNSHRQPSIQEKVDALGFAMRSPLLECMVNGDLTPLVTQNSGAIAFDIGENAPEIPALPAATGHVDEAGRQHPGYDYARIAMQQRPVANTV